MRACGRADFVGAEQVETPPRPPRFPFSLPPSFIVQEACRISFHAIYTDLYEVGMVCIDESLYSHILLVRHIYICSFTR